jgi:uncharacterized protein (DUF1697 family)
MKYAAFFRNVNLGRPGSPGKAGLEQAFVNAGAESASSFLTNGTLVFTTRPKANPSRLLATASNLLQIECGLMEPGFVRSVAYLKDLVELDPFSAVDRSSGNLCCITFLHASMTAPPEVPLVSKRKDVEVLRFTGGEALCLSRTIGKTPGSPNAFLEKLFNLPATTRNWNTVVRLVRKYA